MTQYELAIVYGRKHYPDSGLSDRDIANKYLSTVRKVFSAPDTCKPSTLKGVVEALNGRLTLQVEFTDVKSYNIST